MPTEDYICSEVMVLVLADTGEKIALRDQIRKSASSQKKLGILVL